MTKGIPTYRRTLILGDIHGAHRALGDVLDKADFDPEQDRLICVGDYVHGWPHAYEVVERLLEIREKSTFAPIYLCGNHDEMFLETLLQLKLELEDRTQSETETRVDEDQWSDCPSYLGRGPQELSRHVDFFQSLTLSHIENENLFVHAGFNLRLGFKKTRQLLPRELMWDRLLYNHAYFKKDQSIAFDGWANIFIGHTPTIYTSGREPKKMCNVINLDQGCKVEGRLTCWELETGKWWQGYQEAEQAVGITLD